MRLASIGVTKHPKGGFYVTAMVAEGFSSDDMFDPIAHPVVFKDEERAKALASKVAHNRTKIDLKNWIITDHPCAAYHREAEKNPLMYCVL